MPIIRIRPSIRKILGLPTFTKIYSEFPRILANPKYLPGNISEHIKNIKFECMRNLVLYLYIKFWLLYFK